MASWEEEFRSLKDAFEEGPGKENDKAEVSVLNVCDALTEVDRLRVLLRIEQNERGTEKHKYGYLIPTEHKDLIPIATKKAAKRTEETLTKAFDEHSDVKRVDVRITFRVITEFDLVFEDARSESLKSALQAREEARSYAEDNPDDAATPLILELLRQL